MMVFPSSFSPSINYPRLRVSHRWFDDVSVILLLILFSSAGMLIFKENFLRILKKKRQDIKYYIVQIRTLSPNKINQHSSYFVQIWFGFM